MCSLHFKSPSRSDITVVGWGRACILPSGPQGNGLMVQAAAKPLSSSQGREHNRRIIVVILSGINQVVAVLIHWLTQSHSCAAGQNSISRSSAVLSQLIKGRTGGSTPKTPQLKLPPTRLFSR